MKVKSLCSEWGPVEVGDGSGNLESENNIRDRSEREEGKAIKLASDIYGTGWSPPADKNSCNTLVTD